MKGKKWAAFFRRAWDHSSFRGRVNQRFIDMGLAMSMANLLMIRAWFSILYDDDYGYYNRIPVNTPTLLALLFNLALLTLLLWGGLQGWRKSSWRWNRPLGVLVALGLLLIPLNFFRLTILHVPGGAVVGWLKHPATWAGAAVVIILVFWRWLWFAKGLRALLWVLLPLVFVSGGKLLLVIAGVIKLRQHDGPPSLAPILAEPRQHPRILWLIFDELDFRVVFSERPAGLALPELDRLRSETLFATHARPPAYGTLLSMPALTTGRQVRHGKPYSPSDLRLEMVDDGKAANWHQLPNVFRDARELGYNNAIVAWHHPYRRIFSNVVSFCEWYPSPLFEQARGGNFTTAWVNQWCSMAAPVQQRRLQIQIQQHSMAAALQLATNRQFGFIFLHLPPPHKPGIYVPETGEFTMWQFSSVKGYFDNLALVDRMLGQLRAAMEKHHLWESTWLLVTADHSWRESQRYDGRWDERVPWMLKAPGEGTCGMEYAAPFNTVVTRFLLQSIMRGEVRNLNDVSQWLKRHAPDLPPISVVSPKDH